MTKTNLRLINAWEIGLESPIITALLPDDDPVIPDDVVSPPCLKVLEYFKEIWGKSNY
jgi:hypothetical protein